MSKKGMGRNKLSLRNTLRVLADLSTRQFQPGQAITLMAGFVDEKVLEARAQGQYAPGLGRTWSELKADPLGPGARLKAALAAAALADSEPRPASVTVQQYHGNGSNQITGQGVIQGMATDFFYFDDAVPMDTTRNTRRVDSAPKPAMKKAPNPGPLSRRR